MAPILALLLLNFRPLNFYVVGLLFIGFVALIVFFAYRRIHAAEGGKKDRQFRENDSNGYRLYCRSCGYAWEMSNEEWEAAGRKETEEFINDPSPLLSNQGALNESFEKIEWKPPNRAKVFVVMMGLVGLLMIVPFLVYEMVWAKTHPDDPYAIIVNVIVTVIVLFVYTGLILLFRPRANKTVLLFLLLVVMIVLMLSAVIFLLR